jgi:CheY-like chemotaxis protein
MNITDSSRRAVEAADNVVHAYDMNMGVPETPLSPMDKGTANETGFLRERPDILVTGQDISINPFRGVKRKRNETIWSDGSVRNVQPRVSRPVRQRIRYSFSEEPPARGSISSHLAKKFNNIDFSGKTRSRGSMDAASSSPLFASEQSIVPGLRHTNLREVLQLVINDALKVGGRPDSAIAQETDQGEIIEVRTRSSNGQANTKIIEWTVSDDVPETIVIDEKDLAKMISCVVLNAIKFTENGTITLRATLSVNCRYIVINVKDTGPGIPVNFLPRLFKPFSREDDSTTRQSEGLGLGLMVAKGLARKLGGDLLCVRSDVEGPQKGSEFEIRVPLAPGEVCSRPASPFGSPVPSTKPCPSNDPDAPHFAGPQPPTTPPLTADLFGHDHASKEHQSKMSDLRKTAPSLGHLGLPSPRRTASPGRPRSSSKPRTLSDNGSFDRNLASRFPLNFLVVEDNQINRKLLTSMLQKLGYRNIVEAYDGNKAVEQMRKDRSPAEAIDVVLMDLWMPLLDGFQATEAIHKLQLPKTPTILAVSADITDGALERASKVGMKGFLTKPFQIRDLEKLITQYFASSIEEEVTGS